jgi:ubiquinone/menaquinone biosynthesis C-methylase UbiE
MPTDIFFEIHENLPKKGYGRNKYTRRAFRMLPRSDKPRILDIGCGSGAPTIELARLSQGEIIGIDIHQPSLDRLTQKIEAAGLGHRVKTVNRSMFEIDFPEESFDIIWAEGSIFIISLERGLVEWRRFLKPGGFMAVHEAVWLRTDPPQEIHDYWKSMYPGIKTTDENLRLISGCGYDIIGHFQLPEDAWWNEYYGPLEDRIKELRKKYSDDPAAIKQLDREQLEIDMFKKYQRWYGSAFFLMQKR